MNIKNAVKFFCSSGPFHIYIREITLEENLVEANDVIKHLAITVVPLPSQSMKTEKCYVYSRASLVP